MGDAFATIWRKEGMRGFFKGWTANTLKVATHAPTHPIPYSYGTKP